MALKFQYDTMFGITLPNAYGHISQIMGDKNELKVFLTVFADETARQSGVSPIQNVMITINTSSINGSMLPELYNYIKTLPEFKDAQDC